jgi:sn-glycerol 3-phosphate transport system substrate-binding protein
MHPHRPESRGPGTRSPVAVVVLVVLVLVAAACGSSGSGSNQSAGPTGTTLALPDCPIHALDDVTQPVEVTLWHFLSGKTGDTLKSLVDQYNASQSKVKVRVESQGTSNDELFKKYQAGIKTNDLPGIAVMDDTVTQQMIDSKTVLPAQSCINADNYDMSDLLQSGKDYYTVNGVLWPASLNLSGALLYYNKGQFRKAGLDPEQAPATLEQVREYAQKIKAAGVVDRPVVLKVNSPLLEMWLTGDHVPMVDNDNGRGSGTTDQAAFDTSTTVDLFTWIDSMNADGLLQVIADTPGQVNHYLAMAQQNASMTIETSTAATSVEAFLGGTLNPDSVGATVAPVDPNALDLGAAPVPGISEAGKLEMGGGAWYITNTGPPEVQAAAWDFMKWWNSLDTQVSWNIDASYLPYRNSAAKDPRVVKDWTTTLSGRWLAIAYDELVNGVDPNFPGPLIGPYDQVRQAMRAATDNMVYKGGAPADVVKQASDATAAALDQYNRANF